MKTLLFSLSLGLGFVAHAAVNMVDNVATPDNLASFQLVAPELTEQEKLDVQLNDQLEQDAYQQEVYNQLPPMPQTLMREGGGSRIVIELYQNAPQIGKQFVLVREDGRIRYVFAVSAAASGRSTPGGTFGVTNQLWRHMSGTYPSRGENNMDHVTYFKPAYGFHSTTFGVYSLLGTKQSHGCVRLARPEARALFSLVRANGSSARIVSYKEVRNPPDNELNLVRKLLVQDLNFIQDMIRTRNKGDVPFKESSYYAYLSGDISERDAAAMARNAGIAKILEVDGGKGRIPRSSAASSLR